MVYPLKVIGLNEADFEQFVVSVVQSHVPLSARTITARLSQEGKYLAVTVTFVAESRAQLDAIYQELKDSGRELVAL